MADMEIAELSRDLHADFPEDSIVTTEYEEKFAAAGKKINYVRIKTL
jgi:tRNA (guanine-N7-)-methyltransferase